MSSIIIGAISSWWDFLHLELHVAGWWWFLDWLENLTSLKNIFNLSLIVRQIDFQRTVIKPNTSWYQSNSNFFVHHEQSELSRNLFELDLNMLWTNYVAILWRFVASPSLVQVAYSHAIPKIKQPLSWSSLHGKRPTIQNTIDLALCKTLGGKSVLLDTEIKSISALIKSIS